MKRVGLVVFAMLAVAVLCTSAMAQNVGDNSVYFVTYYANNISAAPDATVRVINDGSAGEATLWATFFVFDDSEELTQCCSCPVTYDGLLSESVHNQLTAYPIRNTQPIKGVIKEISSSTCFGNGYQPAGNPGCGYSTPTTPTAGLRSWATHIQSVRNRNAYGPGPYSQTETAFADANLIASEKTLLEQLCYFDFLLSGAPCTCTQEDYDF